MMSPRFRPPFQGSKNLMRSKSQGVALGYFGVGLRPTDLGSLTFHLMGWNPRTSLASAIPPLEDVQSEIPCGSRLEFEDSFSRNHVAGSHFGPVSVFSAFNGEGFGASIGQFPDHGTTDFGILAKGRFSFCPLRFGACLPL